MVTVTIINKTDPNNEVKILVHDFTGDIHHAPDMPHITTTMRINGEMVHWANWDDHQINLNYRAVAAAYADMTAMQWRNWVWDQQKEQRRTQRLQNAPGYNPQSKESN